jgi:phosphoglycerol transferase MdoB-like AlkP superfamily enzyme
LTPPQFTLFQRLATAIGPDAKRFVAMGATRMKKILIVAATAGLMTLAACNGGSTTNNTADAMADNHEANAAMYDQAADNTSNEAAEAVLENAEDAEENAADAVEAGATANAH